METYQWVDKEYDAAAPDLYRSAPIRLVIVMLAMLVMGANIDWGTAVLWAFSVVIPNAWDYWESRPQAFGRPKGVWARVVRIAAVVASSAAWAAAPVILWTSGDAALRLVALGLLGTLLIVAQSYSFKSRLRTFTFGALPALAFIVLPSTLEGISDVKRLTIAFCFCLGLVYLLFDVRRNVANARALEAAQTESREQKEAAVAANLAKSSFLAMMSHELRTPMNGVLGMAQALTLTGLDDRQARHVEMLIRSGKGLMSILDDILDISKVEAGKLELEVIPFDLHELGQRVVDLWSETAGAKGVDLVYDLASDAPRWVSGDPTRLRQVLVNLVSNAVKFTGQGEIRLSIRPATAGSYDISVADTGVGIPEVQQARLFQPFIQADTSTTRRFGGTGLGLAISRQLVTLMGGRIDLASKEGKGSTFTIQVPLPPAEAVEIWPKAERKTDLAGMRLLVVDDNAINQAVAQALLESVGAVVAVAGDGREALNRLSVDSFDAVLMDIHMPGMGGLEALARIRAGETGATDIPVIALTADAMPGIDETLLDAGFDDVVSKPFGPEELTTKLAGCWRSPKST